MPETHSSHEIWLRFVETALQNRPIMSDHYGQFDCQHAYIGLTNKQVDRCLDEIPVAKDFRKRRLGLMYADGWFDFIAGGESYGKMWYAIGFSPDELLDEFPEYADRINQVIEYNRAVSRNKFANPREYFPDYQPEMETAYFTKARGFFA